MRLNLDIVCDFLSKTYKYQRFGTESKGLNLEYPLLYSPMQMMEPDCLYIVASEDILGFYPSKGISLIVLAKRIPREWKDSGASMVVIENVNELAVVYNDVLKIFHYFQTMELQLKEELAKENDFDLKRILEIGTRMLQNPLVVRDHLLTGIAETEIVKDKDGEYQIFVHEAANMKTDAMIEVIRDVWQAEHIIKEPFVPSSPNLTFDAYCYNLYLLGQFSGCIYLCGINRPIRESDYALAAFFFQVFQHAFFKHMRIFYVSSQPEVAALKCILNHEAISSKEKSMFYLQQGEHWVAFKLKRLKGRKTFPDNYVSSILNGMIPGNVISLLHQEAVVGILRVPSQESEKNQVFEMFTNTLKRMGYIAGISNEFTSIANIIYYNMQAEYIVNVSFHKSEKGTLFFFDDYVLEYMLYECSGKFPAETLFTKGLKALMEYDKTHDTEYMKTLDVYLKNEMGIKTTAEELFIHRSSLFKRIDRIRDILNMDLDDPEKRLYLRICLALLKRDE